MYLFFLLSAYAEEPSAALDEISRPFFHRDQSSLPLHYASRQFTRQSLLR